MDKILKTSRYLVGNLMGVMVVAFLSILLNLAITNTIFYFNREGGELNRQLSNHTEVTAAIFSLLISLIFFSSHFKVMLGNGVSRKSFFWANLITLVSVAATLALFVTLVTLAHLPFEEMTLLSQSLYNGSGFFESTIFQISAYFLIAMLGWVIHLAYYRSGTTMRWVISIVPVVLLWMVFSEIRSSGDIWNFLATLMGFSNPNAPNQLIGSLTFLALAALLSAVVYLLIRRAPLKD